MGEHVPSGTSNSLSTWYIAGHECKSIDEMWVNDTDIDELSQIINVFIVIKFMKYHIKNLVIYIIVLKNVLKKNIK